LISTGILPLADLMSKLGKQGTVAISTGKINTNHGVGRLTGAQ
jgi:hypothetical protein